MMRHHWLENVTFLRLGLPRELACLDPHQHDDHETCCHDVPSLLENVAFLRLDLPRELTGICTLTDKKIW